MVTLYVVTVHPAPEITWYHNGQKIKSSFDSTRYVETREKGLYSLEIKNCQLDDAGEVTITAKNLYGEDDCKASLVVQGRVNF